MKIITDNKFLAKTCEVVPEEKFQWIRGILHREMLIKTNAVGLAANQLGIPYRAFAMRYNKKIIVFINPKITDSWGDELFLKEKCLSLKKQYKVKRCMYIRVTDDYHTKGHTMALTNYDAQVFQHEIDHIDGITIKTRSELDGKS